MNKDECISLQHAKGVILTSAQTGLALPVLSGATPVCTDIRTTPYHSISFSGMYQLQFNKTHGN